MGKSQYKKNLIFSGTRKPCLYGRYITMEESRHVKRFLDMATDEVISAFICGLISFETAATIAFHLPMEKQNKRLQIDIKIHNYEPDQS